MNFGISGFPELNELALDRLRHGVEIFTHTKADGWAEQSRTYAPLKLDIQGLEAIMNACKLCNELPMWHGVELAFKPSRATSPIQGDVVLNIDSWRLHVNADDIYWQGTDTLEGQSASGRRLGLRELFKALNSPPGADYDLTWLGPAALVYDPDADTGLYCDICRDHPDLDAQSRASSMSKVIDAATADLYFLDQEAPMPRSRRHQV
ncbi:hypothetical protein ABIC83_002812 [Roseateles asaccharophilus]|uniref:hypothetical protein n=1 Tax=Roseateles asaccharophilus TaxID=582607 RepID=UPI003839572D